MTLPATIDRREKRQRAKERPPVVPEPVIPTCPACACPLANPTWIAGVTICPRDLRTLAAEGDGYRLATASETLALSEVDMAAIKALRATLRKARA